MQIILFPVIPLLGRRGQGRYVTSSSCWAIAMIRHSEGVKRLKNLTVRSFTSVQDDMSYVMLNIAKLFKNYYVQWHTLYSFRKEAVTKWLRIFIYKNQITKYPPVLRTSPLPKGDFFSFNIQKHTALHKGIFASFIQRRWLVEPEDFLLYSTIAK